MRVAIVGSRNWSSNDTGVIRQRVLDLVADHINKENDLTIISGGAQGVDTIAVNAADSMGAFTKVYKADWKKYGKSAGFVRNRQIVEQAQKVIAFWDGQSKGTKHTIELALKHHKDLEVHFP
jgi:uncharacterized phage-like protein YoqJ